MTQQCQETEIDRKRIKRYRIDMSLLDANLQQSTWSVPSESARRSTPQPTILRSTLLVEPSPRTSCLSWKDIYDTFPFLLGYDFGPHKFVITDLRY